MSRTPNKSKMVRRTFDVLVRCDSPYSVRWIQYYRDGTIVEVDANTELARSVTRVALKSIEKSVVEAKLVGEVDGVESIVTRYPSGDLVEVTLSTYVLGNQIIDIDGKVLGRPDESKVMHAIVKMITIILYVFWMAISKW